MFSGICITVFYILILEYILFTNLTLIRINYSLNNCYVVTVVLEEESLKKETELVPETQCIVFPYIPWRKSKKFTSWNAV